MPWLPVVFIRHRLFDVDAADGPVAPPGPSPASADAMSRLELYRTNMTVRRPSGSRPEGDRTGAW
jgi:hypothetical protein